MQRPEEADGRVAVGVELEETQHHTDKLSQYTSDSLRELRKCGRYTNVSVLKKWLPLRFFPFLNLCQFLL